MPLATKSCVWLFCDPIDCSPPGSSVYAISQARILEWVAIVFSRRFSWCKDQTCASCLAGRFFTTESPATWEAGVRFQAHAAVASPLGFLGSSTGKESTCYSGDPGSIPRLGSSPATHSSVLGLPWWLNLGSIPGLGRSLGGGYGNPLQYSCLGNPHGQRSLAGYSPWGHKELDTTEKLSITGKPWK